MRRANILLFILIGLLAFFQYRLWFESGGILDMMQLKKKLAFESRENDKLKIRNQALLKEVMRLQQNQDTVEASARHDLGMIKKGETFYQVVK